MKYLVFIAIVVAAIVSGCTENTRAKAYGGTMTVNLPPNTKLVTATWKEAQLWYLYRPMSSNEIPVTNIFAEKSSMGLVEGKILFVESK